MNPLDHCQFTTLVVGRKAPTRVSAWANGALAAGLHRCPSCNRLNCKETAWVIIQLDTLHYTFGGIEFSKLDDAASFLLDFAQTGISPYFNSEEARKNEETWSRDCIQVSKLIVKHNGTLQMLRNAGQTEKFKELLSAVEKAGG